MGTFEDLKKLTAHSAIYGLGHIISRGIGFLLLPLYTNYLSTAEYGVVALIFTFIAFVNILFLYGMDSSFLRYYALEDGNQGKQKVLSTVVWTTLCSSICFSLPLFIFAKSLSHLILSDPGLESLIQMAAGILVLDTLSTFPYLLLRMEERSVQFVAYRFVNIILNLGLNIYLVAYLRKGIWGVFVSNLVASGITLVILLPVIWKKVSLSVSPVLMKGLIGFGLPFLPSGLASMTMELIDRYMLKAIKGLDEVGIYNAGYKLGLFMLLVVMAFKFAWQPFFLKLGREEEKAKRSFAAILTYFVLAMSVLLLMVSFFVDDLVRLRVGEITVFGSDYWSGTRVVPVILLAYIMLGLYLIFLPGIYLKNKTRFVPLFTGMGAIINIIGNLILIPRLGMMGAAWSTLAGYLAMAVALYITVQKFYPVKYQFQRLTKLFFITLLLFMLWKWFSPPALMRIVFLVVCYPLGLVLTNFFTSAEKQRLRALLPLK